MAAISRVQHDRTGPVQALAKDAIEAAEQLTNRGNTLTLRWTPDHRGIEGNEQADATAKRAAEGREGRAEPSYLSGKPRPPLPENDGGASHGNSRVDTKQRRTKTTIPTPQGGEDEKGPEQDQEGGSEPILTSETRKSDTTGTRMARAPSLHHAKFAVSAPKNLQLPPNLKAETIISWKTSKKALY